jgi:glucose/arabinose dehydrogenase
MVALVRGRIREGEWVDGETLFMPDESTFSEATELGAGARIAFDGQGHVFLSIGAKGNYKLAQLLGGPDGKILRLREDGQVPTDNPFVHRKGALASIYSYGHRNPQGLAYDTHGDLLWSSEHGPRGGDEGNVILAGRNYGWPVASLGLDYDGAPIRDKYDLGVDLRAIEQPRIDWTPSIGVSSIDFYRGRAFSKWRNNLLVATLSRNELRRYVIEDGQAIHSEVLLDGLSRIRDVEVGADGFVYILLEHSKGSRIVRMRPANG